MKDIVENRSRLPAKFKIKLLLLSLRQNGWAYTSGLVLYGITSGLAERIFSILTRWRTSHGLPGLNSLDANRLIWENWDWSSLGDEWTVSDDWKASIQGDIIAPHLEGASSTLEIGVGGGRWTPQLYDGSQSFWGVDISSQCIENCRERFRETERKRFRKNDGTSLSFIADGTIDFVWSYDVFVHINSDEVGLYLDEIARILTDDGLALIHHGTNGGVDGGWRSDLTAESLHRLTQASGLVVAKSFRTWADPVGRQFSLGRYEGDALTVFRKAINKKKDLGTAG